MTDTILKSPVGASKRAPRYLEPVLRGALALMLLGASAPKLSGDPTMVAMFSDVGGGDVMRLFVGLAELCGAIGLLLPRLTRLRLAAALGLITLLLGAALTNVTLLDENPTLPLVLAAAAGYLATRDLNRAR